MTLREALERHRPGTDTALTIGVFDGVHRGHQALMKATVALAEETKLTPAAMTFHPSPVAVISPGRRLSYIGSLDERIQWIKDLGIEIVVPVTFTDDVLRISAKQFVDLLLDCLRMRQLVVGPDFVLGHKRQGDIPFLGQLGRQLGFGVRVVDFEQSSEGRVSSTAVREAVKAGEMELAAGLLGRPFSVVGVVESGEKRGRELGFPTANLAIESELLIPANGIYACRVHFDGVAHRGVSSIGVRPTFGDGNSRMVEVFLLDFDRDIYGRKLRVEFFSRLRQEERFESAEALVEQMHRDVATARTVLKELAPE